MEKQSFLIYSAFFKPLSKLSDVRLGKLFRAVFMHLSGESVDFGDDLQTSIAFDFVLNQIELDAAKYASKVQRNSIRKGRRGNPNFKKGNPNPYYDVEPGDGKKVGRDNCEDNCERHNCADDRNNVGIMSIIEDNSERDAEIIGIIENRGVSSDFCEIKDNSIYNDNDNDNGNENDNDNENENENEKEKDNIKIKKLIYDVEEEEVNKKKNSFHHHRLEVGEDFLVKYFRDKEFIATLTAQTECDAKVTATGFVDSSEKSVSREERMRVPEIKFEKCRELRKPP